MDNTITTARPDVVSIETTPRPTATPVRVPFSEVLSSGALALVQGAQDAVRVLPGAPVVAAAVRAGGLGSSSVQGGSTSPEGPSGPSGMGSGMSSGAGMMPLGTGSSAGSSTAGGASDGSIESSLAQSQQMSLYYLQIQEQVNDQNRTFTLLSNVIEMEHQTAKSAIGNIH
jgi:hypothetical protein